MTAIDMTDQYQVQKLDGYTNGRPSWRRVYVRQLYTVSKEEAIEAVRELLVLQPKSKFRIRKIKVRA